LAAPERTIDVSALTGWLTLRSIDNEAKRLRALEQTPPSAQPKGEAASPTAKPPAQPSVSRSSSDTRNTETAGAPLSLAPKRAPDLPPAIEVGPLPGRAAQPEASAVGAQR
jgi:large subunit ribosomal protein L24